MPVSEQVFQILLSLAGGPRHGYAIIQDVHGRTDGTTRLTASTLYAALKRLLDLGWIEELEADEESGGPPRRLYRLTAAGVRAGRAEAARLDALAAAARDRRWLPARRTGR
jgi:DNA-binding PadR family transcriptional regulator